MDARKKELEHAVSDTMLRAALRDLVATAEPVDQHLKGRRHLKSREAEEFSNAVTAATKVIS